MITADQKAHWDAFGFLVLRQLFASEEVKELRQATIEVMNQTGGEDALTSDSGYGVGAIAERHPVLTNWLVDDRIYEIMETLLGPDFLLELTVGTVYRGDTPWHGGYSPDKPQSYKPTTHGKIAMYFDRLRKDDGCLRVIPGTHRLPFGDRVHPLFREPDEPQSMFFGVADEDVPCVALESEPGDVIVFTERAFHSAYGSKIGRLQITAEYNSNPTTDDQIAELREFHDRARWSYHPVQSYIDSDNPRIRRMISRLVELGCRPIQV
jgi:hypothetical protein